MARNKNWLQAVLVATILGIAASTTAWAGPVFLTGHDPDFHAQGNAGARNLLTSGLAFVTGGTYVAGQTFAGTSTLGTGRFLWVEGRYPTPSGHLVGEAGLGAIGLTLGVDYDRANASELASVNFSNYSAIAVASTFGALFWQAELDAMIARTADIEAFINAGGGLFAASESEQHGGHLGGSTPYGYLPITVTITNNVGSFVPTAVGAGAPYLLTTVDLNSPTHNSFTAVGGLDVLDRDGGGTGNPTTLAGVVNIGGGGFTPVPEPGVLTLLALGLLGLGVISRKRKVLPVFSPSRS